MLRPALPFVLVAAALAAGCASSRARPAGGGVERGIASWYGPGFHGRPTASGERFDMDAMTAAHQTLPFGTVVEVRNLDNGRRVTVTINDRGPFVANRIIDLSREAARRIGMIGPGTARVELVTVGVRPVGAGRFTVQLGAFRDPLRAAALAARARVHFPSVVVRNHPPWSRVQVGDFASRRQAARVADRAADLGFDAAIVVLDPDSTRRRRERSGQG